MTKIEQAAREYIKDNEMLADLRGDLGRRLLGMPDKEIDYVVNRTIIDVRDMLTIAYSDGMAWLLEKAKEKQFDVFVDGYQVVTIASLQQLFEEEQK